MSFNLLSRKRVSINNSATSVVSALCSVSSVTITDSSWNPITQTRLNNTGGFIVIRGSQFVNGCSVLAGTTAGTVTFVNATELRVQFGTVTTGLYQLIVINPDGSAAVFLGNFGFSGNPSWTTNSDLGTYLTDNVFSLYLSAVSDSNLNYSVAAGSSLPPGVTLAIDGLLGGNVAGLTSDTLYSFNVIASDAEGQSVTRTFTVTIQVSEPNFKDTTLLLKGEPLTNVWLSDASTNNFNITAFGDARPNRFNPYYTLWSNNFDGSGDYLTVPDNSSYGYGTGDFTIEFWLYPNSTGLQTVVSNLTSASSTNPHLYISSTIRYYTANADRITGASLVTGQWYHIALCRNSGSTRLFVNGIQSGSTYSDTNNYGSSAPLGIGTYWNGASPVNENTFNGYISNLRILKGTGLYTTTFTPPTSTLSAIPDTVLLTCQSNRFVDTSSNNHTITKTGDVAVTAFNPFGQESAVTASGYFDGTGDYLTTSYSDNWSTAGSYTLEFWMYPSSLAGSSASWFATIGTGGTGNLLFYVYQVSAGNPASLALGINGTNEIRSANNLVTAGSWYHVAYTFDGTTTRIFLNGTQVASNTTAVYPNNSGTFNIGGGSAGTSFNGYMSNVRLLRGTVLYTSTFVPPVSPLTVITNTRLLTLQSYQGENNNRFIDDSSFNHIIARNGNASQGTFTPFNLGGYSAYLNGSTSAYTANQATFTVASGQNFTIEGWAFPVAGNLPIFIFGARRTAYNADIAIAVSLTGAEVRPDTGNRDQASSVANFPSTMPTGQWSHWALVRSNNGTTVTSYLNGVAGAPVTVSGQINPWLSRGDLSGAIGLWQGVSINNWTADSPTYMTMYTNMVRFVKGRAVYTSNFTSPTTITATSGGQDPPESSQTVYMFSVRNRGAFDASQYAYTVSTGAGSIQVQPFTHYAPDAVYSVATVGGSAYFDGSGDYLSTPSTRIPTLLWYTGQFTLEYYIYPLAFGGTVNSANYSNVIGWGDPTSSSEAFDFGPNSSGVVVSYYYNGSQIYQPSSASIKLREWSHLAIVGNNGVMTMYVNGVNVGGYTVAGSPQAGNNFLIGAIAQGNFNGYLSMVRVSTVRRYTIGFTPPTSPFIADANTVFLSNFINAGIYDHTGKNNLETVGDAKYSIVQKKFGSSSLYFDGTGDYFSVVMTPNLVFGSGDMTIECWIYVNSITGLDSILDTRVSGAYGNDAFSFYLNGGIPEVYAGSFSSNATVAAGSSAISVTTWTHIAFSRNSGTNRLFVNGTSVATNTNSWTQTFTSTNVLLIGQTIGQDRPFDGYIDELRITRGVARYTANFTAPTSTFAIR